MGIIFSYFSRRHSLRSTSPLIGSSEKDDIGSEEFSLSVQRDVLSLEGDEAFNMHGPTPQNDPRNESDVDQAVEPHQL